MTRMSYFLLSLGAGFLTILWFIFLEVSRDVLDLALGELGVHHAADNFKPPDVQDKDR